MIVIRITREERDRTIDPDFPAVAKFDQIKNDGTDTFKVLLHRQ